jgi:Zn-dependent membrane protease YugP
MFFFHPLDIILLLPAIVFTLYAQHKVKSAFAQMSQVRSASGKSGAEVAQKMLHQNGIYDVDVEETDGHLSDHYDPIRKKLFLSRQVFRSNSLAALGVAAHETGHAIQHKNAYLPLQIRQGIFPIARFGSSLAIPLFIAGIFLSIPFLQTVGIYFFVGAVAFTIITLPVEFNASRRALGQLSSGGYLRPDEIEGARKVLNAAAMTYVAAAAVAVLQLIRLLLIRGRD